MDLTGSNFLDASYNQFLESTINICKEMTKIDLAIDGELYDENDDIFSLGVSSIIAYTGRLKGRFLLDMDPKLAIAITENVTGSKYSTAKEDMVLATIAELNNTITGDVITYLNDECELRLRLAPPIVFTGKDALISIPKIYSASVNFLTEFGMLKINIAFEKSK